MKTFLVATAVFLFSVLQIANGQTSNQGSIVGRLTDPNGNVVPAVQVVASNTETGASRTAVSNQGGDYRFDFLQPGRYTLNAEATGFNEITVSGVIVHVNEVQRVDIQLKVEDIQEKVTVDAEAAGINTETATLGEVINERSIQNLPLNGREFIALAALVPGANTGNAKLGAVVNRGVSVGFSGARASYNAFYVDGADSTDANENQLISSPALDAIKEFRIDTSLYSARYGRAGGAIINVVTKSGTNGFHGTLYEYHRNKALDARPYFYSGSKEDQPNYLFNQFGGTIGGPVMLPMFGEGGRVYWSGKNKTFFFFSAEFYRELKPGQLQESFAPSTKERIGDFTESINPYSGQPVVLRNPFTGEVIPGNKIPPELINPIGKRLMNLWPEPNYSGDPILNLRILRNGRNRRDKYLVKIDHTFSSRSSLSGSFNYGKYDDFRTGNTEYSDFNWPSNDKVLALTYTQSISTNIVNDLKFNFTTFKNGHEHLKSDKNYAAEFGLWYGSQRTETNGVPRLLFYTVGNRLFQIGGAGPDNRENRNFYVNDNLVWLKGSHTISMGGDFKQQNVDWFRSDAPLGNHYFGTNDGLASQDALYGLTGSTFASVLMGVAAFQVFDTNDGTATKMRRNLVGLYVQDDWKVSPRLTLNLGLRYDYEAPFSSLDGKFMTLNYKTGLPRYAAGAPADKLATVHFPYETGGPNRPYEPQMLNFAPRFGFAFQPFKDNKTVVRGGYGLVYTSEPFSNTTVGAFVVPFNGRFNYFCKFHPTSAPWPDGKNHCLTVDQEPYRLDLIAGQTPGRVMPTAPYYPSGNVQHWNLSISRDIGWGVAVETAYVGSKGTNLNARSALSLEFPAVHALANQNIPGWGAIALRVKGHNSNYHALQAKATKRLSSGLSFIGAFTWSHALAEASNDGVNENTVSDSDSLGALLVERKWSNADFDNRKRFSFSSTYELPFGRGRASGTNWHPVINSLIGGWRLNLILTLQDGFPFSVRGTNGRIPDRICDGNLPKSQRDPNRWYDFTCFVNHNPIRVIGPDGVSRNVSLQGNAGTNIIIGPGINNVDMGLHKEFGFTENAKVQLRLEAFNLFNHPNLIRPTSNFFVNNSSGATITSARDNRDIQVALKFIF